MGIFMKMLIRSNANIRKDRSARLNKIGTREQQKIIDSLESRIDDGEDQLECMLDQSPNNQYSLQPGKKFEGESFAREYQEKSILLANLGIELEIAKENMKLLFGDDDEAESSE